MEIDRLNNASWQAAYTSKQALTAFSMIALLSLAGIWFWPSTSIETYDAPQEMVSLDEGEEIDESPVLDESESETPDLIGHNIALPEESETIAESTEEPVKKGPRKLQLVVTKGDTFVKIINENKLDSESAHEILKNKTAKKYLTHLKPYTSLVINVDKSQHLTGLEYDFDPSKKLRVWRAHRHFQAAVDQQPLEPHVHFAQATIKNNFYASGQKAGISEKLLHELTHHMAWDIDFAHDLKPGDKFAVMFNDYYLGDQKIKSGDILAASFTCKGHTHRIVKYTDPDGTSGYYTPDGMSIQKGFLRAPLNYTRISSPFDMHRFHPLLHRFRRHEGVDYAAPYGTPIKATANGKVMFVGDKGGYGRTVMIQHGKLYTTVYAHMSNFKEGLHHAKTVKQGDVIGYVGNSGLATGPHVHYEFRVNGQHVDPVKTKVAHAEPIHRPYRQRFLNRAHTLLAQLDLYKSASLANSSGNYPVG